MELTRLQGDERPLCVVSHERSGTHFTMNCLAGCFGYVSAPWIDLDRHQININYFSSPTLLDALQKVAALRAANILKSHHEVRFFSEILEAFSELFTVVYVCRNPADTLASYWRFLQTIPWDEGPRMDTALGFALAPPMARLMRYQYRQYDSMLDRWANHVSGWLDAAERCPRVQLVRYEDLIRDLAGRLRALAPAVGTEPRSFKRPSRTENVVMGGSRPFAPPPEADNRDAITAVAMERHAALMMRLGYAPARAVAGG
jgi:hypothetical protein